MAKKSNGTGLIIIGCIIGLGLIHDSIKKATGSSAVAVIVILIGLVVIITLYGHHKKKEKEDFLALIFSTIDEHKENLGRRRRQLVYTDAYGTIITNKWRKEIDHFLDSILGSYAVKYETLFKENIEAICNQIDSVATQQGNNILANFSNQSTKDIGDHLEMITETKLKELGWNVRRTGGTGDQGADIVAEKNSVRVVLQCKNYGNSVGNSAVQQAIAGMQYEEADYGAVLTGATYTTAAVQIAQKTGILLLHTSDLDDFDKMIFKQ